MATHNHFVLDRGGKVFNRTAPVIKLPATATEDDHLALLGLLNSSTACFWLKQACHNKGSTVDDKGARQRTAPFEDFFAFNATRLKQFPVPPESPVGLAKQLEGMARLLSELAPNALLRTTLAEANREMIAERRWQWEGIRQQMISLQEELDWECYRLYGLTSVVRCPLSVAEDNGPQTTDHGPRTTDQEQLTTDHPPPLALGQRAFEIVLARQMATGELQTTWFDRHGSTPITEIPADWPEAYRQIVQRRIETIESNPNIALIERPEYKRRWNTEPWDQQQERALRSWLLDRLESYFDFDKRMSIVRCQLSVVEDHGQLTTNHGQLTIQLVSVARLSDVAQQDTDFMQGAELFTGRMDFAVGSLVGERVAAESVPALSVLRYKPAAMDKWAAWERTWDLQRVEDAVDALFEVERMQKLSAVSDQRSAGVDQLLAESCKLTADRWAIVLDEAVSAAGYVAEAIKQKLDLSSDLILKPVHDAAKRAKKAAVGDIPVPPKYTSADFLSSTVWRLRGKLDVPKERWVSFPHCEGEDGTLIIAWAGYDHLQLARAIAERFELAKEQEGRQLVPLLAAIGQQIPWLKQWHNELDPVFGTRMGDYFEGYLAEEAKALGMSVEQVMAWKPPEKVKKAGRKK
ncbi:MAG: BREX-2 system adenine-specific DNA-methyltransferase PglX [Planctomycetota bacterium]|nr:BREX-2 system adenine-specific DNA-methyltransferase PglX [Planctomycetota bacterium]